MKLILIMGKKTKATAKLKKQTKTNKTTKTILKKNVSKPKKEK